VGDFLPGPFIITSIKKHRLPGEAQQRLTHGDERDYHQINTTRAVLNRVRTPRKAITAKSAAANGIIKQVGAQPAIFLYLNLKYA